MMRYNIFCFSAVTVVVYTNKQKIQNYLQEKKNKLNKTYPPKKMKNGICVLFGGYVEIAGSKG